MTQVLSKPCVCGLDTHWPFQATDGKIECPWPDGENGPQTQALYAARMASEQTRKQMEKGFYFP